MKILRMLVGLSIFAFALSLASAQSPQTPQEICDAATPNELTEMQFDAAEQVLEADVDYRAIFCTDAGAVYIDLLEELTPITVNNLVFLAEQGYYDSTTFHRVMASFMAQGGDPTATGRGDPGYKFEDEFVDELVFDEPGLLAMANSGPATNGGQFFITTAPTPHLNNLHTIFGEVLFGQENVVNIRLRDPQADIEPGTSLDTIIIITDPSEVEYAYTQDDVLGVFDDFQSLLPPQIPVDEDVTGLLTTEEAINNMPAEFTDAFAEFTETYGHEYRYSMRLLNGECDPAQAFTFIRYTVDAFSDVESAEGALNDEFPASLAIANGLEVAEDADNLYTLSAATCADTEGVYGMSLYTRGRYLMTVEVLIDAEILQQVDIGSLIDNLGLSFDSIIEPIFLSEQRAR